MPVVIVTGMTGMKPPQSAEKPADFGETRKFHLAGFLTGADAPTEADRRHLRDVGALMIFIKVLESERLFWEDVESVRDAINGVEVVTREDFARSCLPAWKLSLSYGARGNDHRRVVGTILLQAARNYPTKDSALRALWRLAERPVPLNGDQPHRNARKDVTRLVRGAEMVAAYRAGRCNGPDCHRSRQKGRYCKDHDAQTATKRAREETRLWALNQAAAALRPREPLRPGVEYAVWLFRSRGELTEP